MGVTGEDQKSNVYSPRGGNIAYRFTDYIFLSGFQTAYGVFDSNDHFDIYYAIIFSANSFIRRSPASDERSPPSKLILR